MIEGGEKAAGIFHSSEIGHDFACTSTTRSPTDKWMLQAYSARQTGLKPALQGILIVVESGGRGGRINAAEFFTPQKLDPILLVPHQPAVAWTNGCYRKIQRIK